MTPNENGKTRKTFPLEMEQGLHKALKLRAVECDQTLHTFIIETLAAKVGEPAAEPYRVRSGKLSRRGRQRR
jgi:predicted HicB family RNase H-like nuclease